MAIGAIFEKTDRSLEKEPATFHAHGRDIQCPHCGGETFSLRHILMNTPGLTFLGLDWANRTAYALVCTACSCVQWFTRQPERR